MSSRGDNSLRLLFVSIFVLAFIGYAESKDFGSWHFGFGHRYSLPMGSLGNWFSSGDSWGFSLGYEKNSKGRWSVFLESVAFEKENKNRLFYKDIELSLRLYGCGFERAYIFPSIVKFINPLVVGRVGIYRWFSLRGEYDTGELFVPERRQKDWSWGFNIGVGMKFSAFRRVYFESDFCFRMVVGELWPSLALRLEDVSSFQDLDFSIRVFFCL